MIRNDVFAHHNDDEMVGPRILYVHLSPAQPVLAESLRTVLLSPDRCRHRGPTRHLQREHLHHRPQLYNQVLENKGAELLGRGILRGPT